LYSVALGVGHIAGPVSDDEHAVAAVRGTNTGSRDAMPDRIHPDLGQLSEYGIHPPNKQR